MFLLHPAFCHSFQVYGWSDRVRFIRNFAIYKFYFKNFFETKELEKRKNAVFVGFQPVTLNLGISQPMFTLTFYQPTPPPPQTAVFIRPSILETPCIKQSI
jgi:hypothetical protein